MPSASSTSALPALGGDGAIAVFGHRDARRRAHEGDGGGNVERAELIAARATDIEDFARAGLGIQRRPDGAGAEFVGERGDFLRRLPFSGQSGEKRGFAFDRNRFRDERVYRVRDPPRRERFIACELFRQSIQHAISIDADGGEQNGKISAAWPRAWAWILPPAWGIVRRQCN